MANQDAKPDQETRDAEKAEFGRDHVADRAATGDEEEMADEALAEESDAERASVAQHEKEMAERGAHQKGEGRIN
jgi:hypothetical protein